LPKKKKPDEMTTREALEHLFPKPLRDALDDAVSDVTDVDDPTADSPNPRPKRPTKGD
jgi:hypothetical protein